MTTNPVKFFVDCADLQAIKEAAARKDISGVTTNPTLARKAGIGDYLSFCRAAAEASNQKPVSCEVIADAFDAMAREARILAALGPNVYVKIPTSDTEGRSTAGVVRELSHDGVKINVTAVFTFEQVWAAAEALKGGAPSIVSVFAGRIADAGVDPVAHVKAAVAICQLHEPRIEVLWASSREAYNVIQAEQAGCAIITLTPDLLKKTAGFGRDLRACSLDTVRMFRTDALASGFKL